jgi:hypothetical protein
MRKSTETSVWAAIFIVCGCIFGVCLACWVTGCSAEQRDTTCESSHNDPNCLKHLGDRP